MGPQLFGHAKEIHISFPVTAGHSHDLYFREIPPKFHYDLHAFLFRHKDICYDNISGLLALHFKANFSVWSHCNTMPFTLQDFFQQNPDRFFVIYDKNSSHKAITPFSNIFAIATMNDTTVSSLR